MPEWKQQQQFSAREFICGFCGRSVASDRGYSSDSSEDRIVICPNCKKPTYFHYHIQFPGAMPGADVLNVPKEVDALYKEARRCISVNANTAAVLACRKLLMHIAVAQGAKEGCTFISYVDFLADKGFVPPNGRGWVDHIRNKGNEANHEILLMAEADAFELVVFSEMLLKFIFEFPSRVPTKS
jgi:hypothetical protein